MEEWVSLPLREVVVAYPSPPRPRTRVPAGDHVVVDALVREIWAALAGEGGLAAGLDLVAARLDQLRGRLSAQFDDEERADLFEQVALRLPRRRHECDRLRGDHRLLLGALDRLRAALPEARRDPAWGEGVRCFLADLADYEGLEERILIEALGRAGETGA